MMNLQESVFLVGNNPIFQPLLAFVFKSLSNYLFEDDEDKTK